MASDSRLRRYALGVVDGLQYGVVLTAVVVAFLVPVSLALSGTLVLVKAGLFLGGILLLGFGALKARPEQRTAYEGDWRPRLSRAIPSDSRSEDGFAGLVNALPPAAWYIGADDRLSDGFRFLIAWLVMWATSYAMEAVFLVGVPPALG
jgi:hypothetical protein